MSKIVFEKVEAVKTVVIGKVKSGKLMIIKWLIRTEDDLFAVYMSEDNGRTGRMIPRINIDSNAECYHESIEAAKSWIENQK